MLLIMAVAVYISQQSVMAGVLSVFILDLWGNLGCNHRPVNLHYIGLNRSPKHTIACHWFCKFFQAM